MIWKQSLPDFSYQEWSANWSDTGTSGSQVKMYYFFNLCLLSQFSYIKNVCDLAAIIWYLAWKQIVTDHKVQSRDGVMGQPGVSSSEDEDMEQSGPVSRECLPEHWV